MALLPFALFSASGILGWVFGQKRARRHRRRDKTLFAKDYFVGLNYLLNEQPDKAVDIFIKMLEVNDNTVETHLALGSLFRRRGEADRAIKVHQNIISRPNLNKELRLQALIELGRDYLRAGVYDRAERLFLEANESGGKFRRRALQHLLDIYEREKDWPQALITAQQLQNEAGKEMGSVIAHYYCELIDDPRNHFSFEQIDDYLRLAQAADPHSLRLGLLSAKQQYDIGNMPTAIQIYKQLMKQEPIFISEILPVLEKAFININDERGLVDYLYKTLHEEPHPMLITLLAEKLQQWHGTSAAIDFLVGQLRTNPSLPAIEHLISLQAQLLDSPVQENFNLVKGFINQLRQQKIGYQCEHCGFSAKKMHWHCPSCRRWDTIKPHYEV